MTRCRQSHPAKKVLLREYSNIDPVAMNMTQGIYRRRESAQVK